MTAAGKRRYHRCNHCGHKCISVNHKVVKGSSAFGKGVRNYNAKLNEELVREMRDLAAGGSSSMECGLAFDVDQKTAWEVITKRTWSHVA
jgi:hypothetical protein